MKRIALLYMAVLTIQASSVRADLLGRYFQGTNIDVDGILLTDGLIESFSRVDANIDYWNGSQYYQWQPIAGQGDNYTVEWTGYIRIDEPGEYGFGTISDDGSQIYIDGQMIVDNGEGQWYDWEDNISDYEANEPNQPVYLAAGFHSIMVRFYEGPSYDGIELWWLLPSAGPSDIPYYGTTFHGTPPTYNPGTNWNIVPADVLYTPDQYNQPACLMDVNSDDFVNYIEFAAMAAQWQHMPALISGDFTMDGAVTMDDLSMLAEYWLSECR